MLSDRNRFVTIWIFARIRLGNDGSDIVCSFVTIWIFARIRQTITGVSYELQFCYHMDFC